MIDSHRCRYALPSIIVLRNDVSAVAVTLVEVTEKATTSSFESAHP